MVKTKVPAINSQNISTCFCMCCSYVFPYVLVYLYMSSRLSYVLLLGISVVVVKTRHLQLDGQPPAFGGGASTLLQCRSRGFLLGV